MNYINTYQYMKTHAAELEIPKYCSIFLFTYLIVRKIGISCEFIFLFYIIILPSIVEASSYSQLIIMPSRKPPGY
ncbi:hypothetical protein COK98_32075 [Bacillus cereus]|uniref:Uncharacterized protein n=1 Tax=Bacillus cereus TaxID=1396 RepID=A0A9X7G4G7_BACCE|nr:hypothetical protein CON26_22585 [Bacillus cereus]PFU99717.1 hypothetical protein COK98_32075 [Bacillus cereus]